MATRTNNAAAAKIAEQASNSAAMQAGINATLTEQVAVIVTATKAAEAAKLANEKAEEGVFSARERVILACAKASHDGGWSTDMIEIGVKSAMRANYGQDVDLDGPGTYRTLKNELVSVMLPDRRADVARVFKITGEAYAKEGEMLAKLNAEKKTVDKTADTPLRAAYGREYHAKLARVRALSEVKKKEKNGTITITPGEKSATGADVVKAAKAKLAKSAKTPSAQAGADLKVIIERLAAFATAHNKEEKFAPIIDTLRKIPHADLVPSGNNDPVYVAPILPAPEAGEPQEGASDLDTALAPAAPAAPAPDLAAQFLAFQAFMASQKK